MSESKNSINILTDSEIIDAYHSIYHLFLKDELKFVNFDFSLFGNNFKMEFKQALEEFVKPNLYNNIENEILMIKKKQKLKIEECKNAYIELKSFVIKVFSDKSSGLNLFGFNDYHSTGKSLNMMIYFMNTLYKASSNNKNKLFKAGYNIEKIEMLQILANDLIEIEKIKEDMYVRNAEILELLNKKINSLKNFASNILIASQIIFKDNPERLEKYKKSFSPILLLEIDKFSN